MLSPDPVTQAPENGQNYNRYTYAYNNPLKYTDPSGYITINCSVIEGGFEISDSFSCNLSFDNVQSSRRGGNNRIAGQDGNLLYRNSSYQGYPVKEYFAHDYIRDGTLAFDLFQDYQQSLAGDATQGGDPVTGADVVGSLSSARSGFIDYYRDLGRVVGMLDVLSGRHGKAAKQHAIRDRDIIRHAGSQLMKNEAFRKLVLEQVGNEILENPAYYTGRAIGNTTATGLITRGRRLNNGKKLNKFLGKGAAGFGLFSVAGVGRALDLIDRGEEELSKIAGALLADSGG